MYVLLLAFSEARPDTQDFSMNANICASFRELISSCLIAFGQN